MERFGGKKSGYENKMAATRFPVAIIHWINVGGNFKKKRRKESSILLCYYPFMLQKSAFVGWHDAQDNPFLITYFFNKVFDSWRSFAQHNSSFTNWNWSFEFRSSLLYYICTKFSSFFSSFFNFGNYFYVKFLYSSMLC